ncbi:MULTISPECIES: Asp-tRNA(Asn)/Glu-tRNA(Gln) amidotransferase subunit GatB [Rhodococcus]|uniref:Aspartyl/glutamyl-tRNA(Asn/Gln) amidotransferase subunit B n=1 Tax=Rhodococcus oxybenzonivorans TaxID=1990687 RepID=A0AAE5A4S5_9NOCA|nr:MULTISPECIES: Asp-tRNA(Asn)/Glu-tRNA(Gln) amidotransferase subunit GatB [Rhodococcus]MDV7244755.1 Asp-tRNA(Asn)/Glu-tRNA(Gln) amidotransferase subunit GatB [Rhodococcus oxybenzonivorans]MDV7264125.1 Asp-tRNA(Asn)/Glu-tRNA(Gln) amidotransferase subunit GatB [Rhodococcus oxybenzonivorans]MDV7275746.1 Asp-tRNA(Asn)/Glu-tRNA(Gln) amidotransferase subunit GatB [Rhodococcus oxybenzonivorans]MDV7332523.1 Asp-tRNA(Asn)/Glu-tRNA(Gln) amidotransferase subunit GatB [Rhodococcus oxybenzonivorans]MDV734
MTAVDAPALLDYDDVLAKYEPVLGMEVHVELGTNTKMFCPCPTEFGAEPNTQVCPVCLGLPGSLPVVNEAAVESAIRIGLALNCSITPWGRFARKNYFYPDQPKNYQISQYDEPIATDGYLDVVLDDGTTWRVEIERAHMEEDTGKSLHVGGATGRIHGASHSLLDYNRAGVPLVEIVTKTISGAGARAPEVARAYVTALRDLLKSLKVSDVRMDQGSMRCDSNVSLMPIGATELGTRTETKNVNSLKSVEVAVRYEMRRQAAVLESGGAVIQETRHFQEADGTTSPGRRKETAEDYRYFPEPDLEPVAPSAEWIEELRGTLPELPWVRRARIQADWGVSDEVMRDLVNAGALDLVIATADAGASPEAARSWWVSYLAQQANTRGVELTALPITPAQVAEVVALIDNGTLNNKVARQVVDRVLDGEGDPKQVVANHPEFVVERDDTKLKAAVDEALAANPDIADKIRGGKVAAAGKIVGDVMKATRGQADPARVKELVIEACS